MRLYIAGPMTGIEHFNYPAFEAAAGHLCDAGYEVRSPHDNGLTVEHEWQDHMRADIRMLLECDGVALLDGWMESRGARLEESIAHALSMPRRSIDQWANR